MNFLKEMRRNVVKILCLGGLVLLVAGPTLAQEQIKKEPAKPAVQERQPAARPKRAAPPPKCAGEAPRALEKQEIQLRGKSIGKIGGQEIRAQEGEEDKQPR